MISILDWIKQHNLKRRGLTCGKKRQSLDPSHDVWRDFFDTSLLVRLAVISLAFFGIIQVGRWESAMEIQEVIVLAGLALFIMLILIPITIREVWESNQLLLLIFGCLICNLLLNKAIFVYETQVQGWFGTGSSALLVPSAITPMLITVLISPAAGFVTAFLLAMLGDVFLETERAIFISTLLTGFSAAFFTQNVRRWADLLMAGVKVALVGLVCVLLLTWIKNPQINVLIFQSVWAMALGVITAFVVYPILRILEWLFDRITDITWVELTDLKHPLLKRLAEEAPGTYHHSLNVANLAEGAAEAIGANATQCRVCAYFHDVGKLAKPRYFIENYTGRGKDPHSTLNPTMSALIIISHVKEGVNLALQYGLRRPIIEGIEQHHGTSTVYFFYHRAKQQYKDAIEGGKILNMREDDIPEVDEGSFQYPGPIPQYKEAAILSLADSLESASRSLKNPTERRIEDLVHNIIKSRVESGQLDECKLTFNELSTLAKRFTFILKSMMHSRIEYPRERKEEKKDDRKEEALREPLASNTEKIEGKDEPDSKPNESKEEKENSKPPSNSEKKDDSNSSPQPTEESPDSGK